MVGLVLAQVVVALHIHHTGHHLEVVVQSHLLKGWLHLSVVQQIHLLKGWLPLVVVQQIHHLKLRLHLKVVLQTHQLQQIIFIKWSNLFPFHEVLSKMTRLITAILFHCYLAWFCFIRHKNKTILYCPMPNIVMYWVTTEQWIMICHVKLVYQFYNNTLMSRYVVQVFKWFQAKLKCLYLWNTIIQLNSTV